MDIYETYYGEFDKILAEPHEYFCKVLTTPTDDISLIVITGFNTPLLTFGQLCDDGKYRAIMNPDENGVFISEEDYEGLKEVFKKNDS